MEEDILDSPTETKHMPPSPSQPILSPHSSTSQHVTPTHSQHVTTVPSQHVTPAHSQNVTPVPSQHVTPAHSQNVTPVPSRHVTPVQSPHAPPLPFQNMHPEDFMKPLEINEEESVLPTPRVRRLTRHHTLKYSGGALHDLNQSPSFDHTHNQSNQFNHSQNQSASSDRTKNQSASSDQPKNQSASSYRPRNQSASFDRTFDPPASKQRIFSPRQSSLQEQEFLEDRNERKLSREGRRQARHTSINDEDDLEDRVQSEGSMRYKLPPLVNVEDDRASLRLPRTRGSYSLSRTERRGDQSDENRENSPSFKPSLLVVNPTVFKSASMSNMSSMSGISGDSTNSIPASEARKRSYLVGSVGPTSLLGVQELEKQFPDRTIRIFVGTWNMNGQIPPRHLCEFLLPANLQYVPDVLVVGTQETFPEKTEWEVRLQDTLGPSHVLFHSVSLGCLHITVFLRRDLIWYCSIPEDDSFSTRPGAQFKTKGALAVAFIIFGTSFIFVNSHLTAHQENVKDRVKDLHKIFAMLNLPKVLPLKRRRDIFDSFDCVFWCGDLNFRLEQSREEIIRDIEDGLSVLETDQLTWLMSEGTVFRGFREHPILFRPTYKYDPGTDEFDTSTKQRIPSYTDRVLYKHHPGTRVKPLHYDSVQGVVTSDHKPVWGMFEVGIRPGKDSVPLAGGLFNRHVYLEGLKRRSESLKPSIGKSAHVNMCTIS